MGFRIACSLALILAVVPCRAANAQPAAPGCPLIAASAVIAGNAEIVLIDTTRGELLNFTSTPGDESAPAWSPDGRTLAFAAQRAGNWDIYTQNLTGDPAQRLTSEPWYEGSPAFSPDGRQIAYESHAEGDLDVYVISMRGGMTQAVITARGADTEPQWVGRDRLLYSTWRDEERALALHSLADGSTTLLTAAHEEPSQAAVSPDGRQIAYLSNGDSTTRLRLRELSGGRSSASLARHSAWPFWSADGQLFSLELAGGGDYGYPTGWTLSQRAKPADDPVALRLPELPGLSWQRPSCAPARAVR
ncbi:MAG: PD40 domain-containing protein, partial [Roseiflexaceae bacterium]|nr:PD40 domain-containing protein [Roseiflexaceae bacterium]